MFDARNLMVNLAAHAGVGAAPALIICAASCHICSATCPDTSWWCGYSYGCGYSRTILEAQAAPTAEQTAQLKEQLKQALADIEKQEKAASK
jgi:hypothetical protein